MVAAVEAAAGMRRVVGQVADAAVEAWERVVDMEAQGCIWRDRQRLRTG